MKKIATAAGVVIILILGVGFGVARIREGVTPETTGPVPATTLPAADAPQVTEHVTGQDSLQSVLALGKSLECSFRSGEEGTPVEGTAFFADGKVRVDTMYTGASSSDETANLIISNETMYTWSKTAAGSVAVKIPLSAVPQTVTAKNSGQVSLENKVQYDCKPWHVDGSVFVPPTTIQFMDMGEMLKGFPGQ